MIADEFFALNPMFPELFGVAIEGLRPGTAEVKFNNKWKYVPKAGKMSFTDKIERLWVRPTTAETVASFEDGRPFLLINSFGKGKTYLATFPFPLHLDLAEPRSKNCLTAVQIMKSVRDIAGCRPVIEVDSPWIETAVFCSTRNGDDWGVIVNYDRADCNIKVAVAGDYSQICDARGKQLRVKREKGGLVLTSNMEPNGATMLQLRR
jgi:hypothetical protein